VCTTLFFIAAEIKDVAPILLLPVAVPRAIFEKLVVQSHEARTHAKPNQRQILAGPALKESITSVQLDMFHLPPMPVRILWGADGSVHTDI
jgi:hypothetical protein